MNRRRTILLTVVGTLLALGAALSYQYMVGQESAAQTAAANLAEGLRLMGQIEALSHQPMLAADRERQERETVGLVEDAAKSVGIKPKRFAHQGARRLGDTVYKEKPMQVLLQGITLRQLVDLELAVSQADAGLNLESIRLSIPREGDANDLWTAEVVLSYLIYDPPPVVSKQEPPR
jgi:hypothetical protein